MADLNGDGKLDFILSGYSIMVFMGNGDGTFSLKQQFNEEGFNLQIADLNGDGIPDFVIAVGPGLQVFLGNGDGSFRTGQALAFSNGGAANPALGDFNHDGKLDIAVASFQTNQVQIFLGNGDGTFSSPVFYATGIQPQFTLAVDLNHDGNLDLAVTSQGDGLLEISGVSILLGNSDGTFRPRSFIKQPDYSLEERSISDYLAAADFDGDGNMDLLVQAMLDPTTYILYGTGAGSFEPAVAVATNAEANTCLPGDFDGDGKPDIVCPGGGLTVVTNQGNRTFSPTTYFPGSFNAGAVGDFNQDGKLDLVVAGAVSQSNGAIIFLNSRAVTQTVLSIAQPGPQYGQISHLIADVNTDAMGYNTGCFSACPAGSVTWMDGSTVLATTPLSPGPDHSGTTSFDTYFSGGSHSISASYSGGELPSTSITVALQVFPAPATLTVAASPASLVYGAGITISLNAAAASPSLAVPTGTVAIQDNGAPLATLPLNASGQASLTSTSLSGGNHAIQAKYAGDANYMTAVAVASFVVQPGPVQLALNCTPNPAASDEALQCVARLSDPIATGSVSFSDGAKLLGSAPVSAGQAMLNFGPLAAGTHTVQASYSGDANFSAALSPSFGQSVTSTTKVIALAAADGHPSLAPQAIGAAYGTGFASGVSLANPGPLPNMLGGVHVTITDANGAQQAAPLFFVSSNQINFLTPALAAGPARVQINNVSGAIFTGPLDIQQVSPALFSANGDGKGVAAAYVVHVGADGVQATQPVFECGKAAGSCVPLPADLGEPSDQNTLVLYGSGIRNASKVGVLFDTVTADVVFFGAQTQFAGLDQVNVRIPSTLAGHGDVHIALTADGQSANQLLMQIK